MEDDVEKRRLAASERQKMKRLEAASPRREATSCRFVRINENIKIAYCLERKNSVDAERFVNYYASNGWIVGKTKMKDWKAAVRTWERRDANGGYRIAGENKPADKRTWDLDIIEL